MAFVPLRLESVMSYSRDILGPRFALRRPSVGKQNVGVRLGRTVFQFLRYVTQVDGAPGVNPDHNLVQLVETCEKSACFNLKLAIVTRKTTSLATAVRVLKLADDCARCKAVGRKPLSVEKHYPYLA